ncbi:MAG TPA: DnaA regulatory inactivator Hda [Burkholderiales bacterium]
MQLALNLRLRDASSFENFLSGANREAVARLRALVARPPAIPGSSTLFLWGERGSGKTHLLEAACRAAAAAGEAPIYLPLGAPELTPAVLEAIEDASLICIDDLERVAGNDAWEAALFALYELSRTHGTRLVAAAAAPPARLGCARLDLATRLAWGPVYQLRALGDGEKLEAMRLRAANRGLELSDEVLNYILKRYPRDLASLFALLDRIDAAALARQRRVTIPFLRDLEGTPPRN